MCVKGITNTVMHLGLLPGAAPGTVPRDWTWDCSQGLALGLLPGTRPGIAPRDWTWDWPLSFLDLGVLGLGFFVSFLCGFVFVSSVLGLGFCIFSVWFCVRFVRSWPWIVVSSLCGFVCCWPGYQLPQLPQ